MFNSLVVDNITYNVACSATRTVRIQSSNISGMMLDKTYYNDVIASYLDYTVKIAVPVGNESEYAALYEVLSNPVSEHSFILPYNQTTVEVVGRIDIVKDQYVKQELRNGTYVNLWRNISFNIISNRPYKIPQESRRRRS